MAAIAGRNRLPGTLAPPLYLQGSVVSQDKKGGGGPGQVGMGWVNQMARYPLSVFFLSTHLHYVFLTLFI